MITTEKKLSPNGQKPDTGAMQASLQLLPLIMNNIPQAVFWKDKNLVYLGCNQAFADDAGFESPEDMVGKTDFDMPWKDQAELYRADDRLVMESGEPKLNYEEPQTTPDGSTIWLRTSKIPVRENGETVAVLGMYEDITAQKQAEKAVSESEERFRRFTEATVEGLIFHEGGTVVDVNPAAVRMIGASDPKEFIGKNLLEFIVPESRQLVLEKMQSETVLPYEIQCNHRKGYTFPVETSTRAYKFGDREIRASSMRDVTERKRAEKLLQQNEATLSSALHIAQMGHWEFDLATGLFTLNDQYYSLHGMTAEQVGGYQMNVQRFAQEFVYPEDAAVVGQATQQAIETTDPNFQVRTEARILHADGKPRWVTIWFRVEKDAQGRTVKLHGVNQDITERKRLQDEVQEAFERRGRQVQLSTQVSQAIAAASSLEELYERVVTEVKEKFGYYHTQLLRYDAGQEAVVLVTGYGETGAKMLAARHRMPMGEGLIGTAAATGETVLRSALENDPDWHPNPLLPETKGEIAVPIKLGDNILGVLDVQSSTAGALDADDQLLLEGLCGQIATAIESTRLRQEMTERLEEINRLYRAMSHEGWQSYRATAETPAGFMFDQSGLRQVEEPTLAEELFANVPLTVPGGEVIGTLAIADDPEQPLSSEDKDFLQQVSEQVALALESARLFEQTQTALTTTQESETRLSEALNIAKLANWEYDVEKDIFTFNDHFYSIFHTTVEQVGGYQLPSADYARLFVHPDDMPIVGNEIGRALASTDRHYSAKLEHRILFADGGTGHISVEIHIDRDENGKILRYYGANQDITERKKAELAIQESEGKLSEALNLAKLANWEYDLQKDKFIFNDNFYSIFHTTAEQVGGYELSSEEYAKLFVHPEDAPLVGQEIAKGLNSTDPHFSANLEHRFLYADGGIGYITVEVHIERDETGKITRWYGANQDITERKKAELAIQESEARLSEALKIAKLANWEYDFERDRFIFNDHFFAIFHTTANQVGGYEVSSADYARLFVHPDDAALVGNEIGKAVASTDRYYTAKLEHRILFADGGVGYISVDVHIERDENGKITRWYGANQDITERKKAEEVIHLAQQRAQIILESVTVPMVITRLSDNHLTFVNPPALEVTQYKYEDVINQQSPDFYVNAEDRKNFIAELRTTGRVSDMVVQLRRANEEGFWALLSAQVFDYQGETSILTTFMDITERIRAQESIAKRATELATVAQVGTTASTVLDPGQLLQSVVDLTKERFGLYHAHIYLINREETALALTAGAGEVGKQMLAEGWSIPTTHELSIIASAYRERQSVIANDVSRDKDSTFLSNRLLPDTRSELAIPMIAGEKVLGIFDVQSDQVDAFGEQEAHIYTTLAAQVAVALQNARLFDEVEQQRGQLSDALKSSHLAYWEYDFANDVFTFNDQFYAILRTTAEREGGYTMPAAQYAGRFVHPEDIAIVGAEIQKAVETTDPHYSVQIDHRIIYADGEVGYFSVRFQIEKDAEGRTVRSYGANQDITERKRAEEILRVSEAKLSEALNIARLANWEYDVERDIFLFNDHFYLIFHTTAEQVGGYELSSADYARLFVHPDDLPIVGTEIEKALASTAQHYSTKLEHRVLFADGGMGYISVEIHIDRDENGKIIRYYGANQDITERKKAEQIIAQRALQLATVATVSTTASTVLDPDQLLQSVVDLTKQRFGLYHAHIYLADQTWQTLLLAAGAGDVGRRLVAEKHAIPMGLEFSLVARAARERIAVIVNDVNSEPGFLPNPLLPETCAEMAVPMIVGDKVLGVFDVQSNNAAGFSDEDANIYVTLATQVGVALQNARLYVEQTATVMQLRELDKLKSSFLANMSHELRTPLNSILGFTDVIMEGLDGPLTEYMDNDLRLIQKNGQHLLHLINDVLDMAKIEAGRMNLNPESFRAFEVMEDVTSITSTLASEKNLSLYLDEESDQDIKIYADRTRLRQVLINLVNNAIKFTESGKVSLKVAPMSGARILITVKDTGIGIAPDKLDAIFQEFTQVDSSTTRKAGGTGLGLPISRRLVEMHGGRLWADSTGIPGEGSTFFVELPLEARITEVIEKQEK